MVSNMAMEDVDSLRKQGINVTPREIVKLNALGVKAQYSPNASSFYSLPRCAFLGSGENQVVFREPTIAQNIWFENVCRVYDEDDDTTSFFLRAYSLTKENLPEWSDLKTITGELKKFIVDVVGRFTLNQVMACVNYCLDGSDADEHEEAAKPERELDDGLLDTFDDDVPWSDEVGVIRESQALGLGISIADAMKMTTSELQQVIQMAYQSKGVDIDKKAKNRAIADYYRTLDAIRISHLEEIKRELEEEQKKKTKKTKKKIEEEVKQNG